MKIGTGTGTSQSQSRMKTVKMTCGPVDRQSRGSEKVTFTTTRWGVLSQCSFSAVRDSTHRDRRTFTNMYSNTVRQR